MSRQYRTGQGYRLLFMSHEDYFSELIRRIEADPDFERMKDDYFSTSYEVIIEGSSSEENLDSTRILNRTVLASILLRVLEEMEQFYNIPWEDIFGSWQRVWEDVKRYYRGKLFFRRNRYGKGNVQG